MTISTKQQKQLCALERCASFCCLVVCYTTLTSVLSIIFAEVEPPAAAEQVRVPKAVAGLKVFSSAPSAASPAARALVEAKALRARLILR